MTDAEQPSAETADRAPDGVYVVDKSKGPSSHGVVARARRILGTKAVGHAGTLDPMATGVLVVAVGEATKLAGYLLDDDKTYETEVRLGEGTETLDAEGKERSFARVSDELLRALDALREPAAGLHLPDVLARALDVERTRTRQTPPVYSALKVDGQRAYARARKGQDVALADRDVVVHAITFLGAASDGSPTLRLRLHVGKGYYVRAFGRDLAASLGTLGHLVSLRRVMSGGFTIDEAVKDDAGPEAWRRARIDVGAAARRALPSLTLPADAATHARFGRRMPATLVPGAPESVGPRVLFDEAGTLLAIGEVDAEGVLRILRGFSSSRP